ncbi:Ribosomal large subunit pseudouridine synthase B [Commensalibacter sp. Nvir]|uniref:pseudouridine synthase n=1 Tax=Commensalibacter sp. Nvir TaxID=3069817 RepID=UPI002D60E096|nr:Ribosomal large subunit pseudouridine synthase B [Commensalibacter sp. Nvir]
MQKANTDKNNENHLKGERIAKWLARAGIASRRQSELLIQEGKVSINHQQIKHPSIFVQENDIVQVEGKVIAAPERTRLWRYHKPVGVITTHKDPKGRKTVFESLPDSLPRVISVGRLDFNSEGILLLTNDGKLARRLELPSSQWTRRYRVRVYGKILPEQLKRLSKGVTIETIRYAPMTIVVDSQKGDNSWLTVSLQEGRNREIRKAMQFIDLHVNRLVRVAYGPFQLGTLPVGTVDEVPYKVIKEQLGLDTTKAFS